MLFTTDTVVVITGSSRGLGLEYVKQILSTTESTVVATARNLAKADALHGLANKHAKRIQLVALDVSDESSIKAAVDEVSETHSGVDLLINNAGIDDGVGPIWEMTGSTYNNILKVNVTGTFLVTKAFVPLLKRKQSRTVVQLSSLLGSTSFNRLGMTNPETNPLGAKWIAYNPSKAAVNMQTSIFANALKDDRFCIISMAPGWVNTDMGGGNARKMGMEKAPLEPKESIAKMLQVLEGLSHKNSGEFLDLEGKSLDY